MYVCTSRGLEPLSRAMCPVELVDALDVFAGEMSCCQRGHPDAAPCDQELLMLPLLGIYAEIYKNRRGPAMQFYAVIEPFRDRFFPATFDYKFRRPDGTETVETMPLFEDLVDGVELAVYVSVVGA